MAKKNAMVLVTTQRYKEEMLRWAQEQREMSNSPEALHQRLEDALRYVEELANVAQIKRFDAECQVFIWG